MGFWSQLRLLLWKNWILQRNKVKVSIFEIVLPLLFAVLLLYLRNTVAVNHVEEPTKYQVENLARNNYNSKIVGYTPGNPEIKKLMTFTEEMFREQTSNYVSFKAFADEDEMEGYFKYHSDEMQLCLAFRNIEDNITSLPKDIEYAIRPEDGFWETSHTYGFILTVPRYESYMYEQYGVLNMQTLMGKALIKYWLSKRGESLDNVNIGTYSQRIAFPPYTKDNMINVIEGFFPIILVLSFILCVSVNTKYLVYEKEMKLKESMKMMGLKASVHWLSWFITFCIYLIPVLLLYAILIGGNIIKSKGPILQGSDVSLIFVFLLLYGLCIITFCFMVSSFVQKANVGASLSGILFFLSYCPYIYIGNNYGDISKATKLGACMLFNCAMGLGARIITHYEGTGEGAKWANFHQPATVDDDLSLLNCMLMLILDSFIHLIIYWYLENVRPGDFGVPKPWNFCFTRWYWCGTGKISKGDSSYESNEETRMRFEKEPANLTPGIRMTALRKVFNKKVAVEGMNLNMYEGQITVLLGHNGAGKTTTMSMLTGFIPPTSGTATVNGYDVIQKTDSVRQSLGLCPQHNILFDTLTVKQHLEFFAMLKGATSKEATREIESLVKEVDLQAKINSKSQELSGGQKRKLSVAIALIAGSKIVILDEPSSGMDPAARRQTWSVLQNHREGRTMVLTTHYMDEADVLGDRIAIMAQGIVKCCGSSMFLKKLYGADYHLVVVKDQNCVVTKVTDIVTSHIENATLETVINQEITYLLSDKETAKFPALFSELEERKDELGINSFGTSATTMEEVFLKVGDNSAHHDDIKKAPESNDVTESADAEMIDPDEENSLVKNKGSLEAENVVLVDKDTVLNFNKGFEKKTGLSLMMGRMHALFVKKALHTWRNRMVTLAQVLVPILFTVLALQSTEVQKEVFRNPPLTFDLSRFDRTYIPTTAGLTASLDDKRLEEYYASQFSNKQRLMSLDLNQNTTYDEYTLDMAKAMSTGPFNKRYIIGFEAGDSIGNENIHAIARYNGQPIHARPIAVNYLMNALLQFYLNSSSYSLQSSLDPLPWNVNDTVEHGQRYRAAIGFQIGVLVSFGMATLTALFIYFLVKERQVGAKHLQVVSGVSPLTYWIPTFLWDFIVFMIPCLLTLIMFAIYQRKAYVGEERPLLMILVFVMYGWAMLPSMYALQFLFTKPPSSVTILVNLNIFSGLICVVVILILDIKSLGLEHVSKICNVVFMILFPNYSLTQSLLNIYTTYQLHESCAGTICDGNIHPCCQDTCQVTISCINSASSYLAYDRPGIGAYMLFMFIQGILYFTIVFMIECHVFQRIWYIIDGLRTKKPDLHDAESNARLVEDSDVAAERQRINSNSVSELSSTDSLILVNLFKRYGTISAVDHTCVGIPKEECFGLLGQNGAGKTTTFKMLTGDVMLTGGNAYIAGYDIRNNIKNVQSNMGYCPQFDSLLEQMTGRETLVMYARLRGVPEENIKKVVNSLIEILMLTPDADKLAGNYSGGNKRKLSTAIALVGDPQFIMLDEPTTGMDPVARRQLWNVLSEVRASGRTLIFTSHSMEECDAMCTRIAIMVNGHFACLGSPQYLKNKFGQGYTLIIQLNSLEDGSNAPIGPVVDFVCANLPGAKVFDDHQGYIHFQVPDASVKLSTVFSLMESTKVNLDVRDYSVQQTSLEQVFLMFTRAQAVTGELKSTSPIVKLLCCRCMK